jgi:hypothetical protein
MSLPGRALSGERTVMANGALSGDVPMPRVTVTTTGSSVTLRAVIESRAGDFASEGALVESCERAVSVRPSGNAKSIATRAMNVIGLDNRRIEHAHGSSVALTHWCNHEPSRFSWIDCFVSVLSRRFAFELEPRVLRVGLLLPAAASPSARDVSAGAALALSESERAGQLFGQSIQLSTHPSGSSVNAAVIIGGMTAHDCLRCRELRKTKVLCFSMSGRLRIHSACRVQPHMFHIAASDAMISAATAATVSPGRIPVTIELWQSALDRYGARSSTTATVPLRRPMTSSAWADGGREDRVGDIAPSRQYRPSSSSDIPRERTHAIRRHKELRSAFVRGIITPPTALRIAGAKVVASCPTLERAQSRQCGNS